jgi:hypothetical protein
MRMGEASMKIRKIIGWGLILLSLVGISYAINQQTGMGHNIKALHQAGILSTLISGANLLWLNKRV